ncbi:hypothetical protein D3C79_894050 [compost metagenome]
MGRRVRVVLVGLATGRPLVVITVGIVGRQPGLAIAAPVAALAGFRLAATGRQQQAECQQQDASHAPLHSVFPRLCMGPHVWPARQCFITD